MKLVTVVVYDIRISMKEDNPGLKNIKGDNYLWGTRISFLIGLTVVVL